VFLLFYSCFNEVYDRYGGKTRQSGSRDRDSLRGTDCSTRLGTSLWYSGASIPKYAAYTVHIRVHESKMKKKNVFDSSRGFHPYFTP
jgi:hypothetical protein